MVRKRRTRNHVIEDLSLNHIERHALQAGFAVDRVQHDYGIDLYVFTYDDEGGIEAGQILIQAKATDHLRLLGDRERIAIRIQRADLERWLGEIMPVVLVVYDAQEEVAYWLDLQSYFERSSPDRSFGHTQTVTVDARILDRLDASAFRLMSQRKNRRVGGAR